ncbi:hypothetical protein JW992_05740, partial [candidate division KSB1 bacterium]|nr:hypothetical protein [candidate division KSB1 bacterium]
QWPVSDLFTGYLFVDALLVAKEWSNWSLSGTPWAVGMAVGMHSPSREWARAQAAVGTEGVRLTLSVAADPWLNNRLRWE